MVVIEEVYIGMIAYKEERHDAMPAREAGQQSVTDHGEFTEESMGEKREL